MRPPRFNCSPNYEISAPQFASFVISFAVLGVFWYGHHMELHFIVRSDRVHLGITLAFLLTIAFVPFSASLLGRNHQFPLAATIYGVNLCLAGMVRYAHWVYATAGHRLVILRDPEMLRYVRLIFLLVPLLYMVAAALAWLNTIVALVCFALSRCLRQTGPPYAPPDLPSRHILCAVTPATVMFD